MSKNPLKILRDLFGAKSRSEAADIVEHAAPGYKARIDEANQATLRTGNEHAFSSRPIDPGYMNLVEGYSDFVTPEPAFPTVGGATLMHHTHPVASALPSSADLSYFDYAPGLNGLANQHPSLFSISQPNKNMPTGDFLTAIDSPSLYDMDRLSRDLGRSMRGIARPFEALRPSELARHSLKGREFAADDTATRLIESQLLPYLTLKALERRGQVKNFLDLPQGHSVTHFESPVGEMNQIVPFTDPARARDVLDDLETRSKRLLGFHRGGLARATC